MKKNLLIAMVALLLGASVAFAGQDKAIEVGQLPAQAREFIDNHFSDRNVALAKADRELFDTTYEVVFTDGSKIEFDRKGAWKEIDCRYAVLPPDIVPQQIAAKIAELYPNTKVVELDRDKRKIEAKLSNRMELTFDNKYNLIDIDD